ncbi:MAG: ATP-binding cassette domain-containing protein, partial [Candidatus Sumerlaeia bacterium]|nr:ATP-binding cassette domain-containing protein [Candidatus Sumerlaeia bacterium]
AGEQQRVEIVKVLLRGADLLILDEPTSVLTPKETEELFTILRQLVAKGKTVLFISHKLSEVLEITNRIIVLRRGKLVGSVETSKTTKQELARMMVDGELSFHLPVARGNHQEPILAVEEISVKNDMGLTAVRNLSFVIHKGEIFGIAGVAGNGQKELVEALTGLRKIEKGKVKINGIDITNTTPRFITSNKISHIPEERLRFGVVPALAVYENSVLNNYYRSPFAGWIFLNYPQIKNFACALLHKFEIQASSIKTRVRNLSGGNIQKLILARELANNPLLIIASHPTYGLDVAATESVRGILLKRKEQGCAILLVSEDLEELLALSDRIAVMFEGKFMGIVENKDVNIEQLGLMLAGVEKNDKNLT